MNRTKHLIATLLLSLCSVGVALLMAEGVLRMTSLVRNVGPSFSEFDPVYGKRLRRNFSATRITPEFTMRISTNSLGFRGAEPKGPLTGGLLFIGDSYTEGYGVNDDEAYPALIAARRPNVPVINAGIGNTGNGRWLRFLDREAPALKPRAVVFQMTGNDFGDNLREHLYRLDPNTAKLTAFDPAPPGPLEFGKRLIEKVPGLSYSYLLAVTYQVALDYSSRSAPPPAQGDGKGTNADALTLALIEQALTQAKTAGYQVFFLLVEVPPPQRELVEALLKRSHIPYLAVPTKQERPDLYYTVDAHWNAAGHRYVADALLARLTP